MDINFSYRDVPTIGAFARSDAFFRALIGPFGSGKSSGCVVEFPRRACVQAPGPDGIRRTRWLVTRNTFPQLRDTTLPTFFQWLPPIHFGRWFAQDRRYVVKAFPGVEFEVLFRALDRPDDIRNLLSLDLTGGWINEIRETPWPIVDAIQGRLGRYPPMREGGPTWFGLWSDTNPPDTDSRFYRYFEEQEWLASFHALKQAAVLPATAKPEEFAAIFHQPSGLAPNAENLANLPSGYYQRLGIGKSKEWVKVYIEGQYGFVSGDKVVFPEFIDGVHVKPLDPVAGRTIYRGWDFGLTPAMTLSQVLPDGRWLIFDELISESMGIDRFSDQVLDHCARQFRGPVEFDDYGDPAGESRAQTDERTCFEILHNKGIMIQKAEQSPTIRIESVRKPLRTSLSIAEDFVPQLVLHPRCKVTRKAFLGGYHYRRLVANSERYTNEPEKNHPYSDVMDTVEYVATILFGPSLTDTLRRDDYPRPPNPYGDQGRSEVTGY